MALRFVGQRCFKSTVGAVAQTSTTHCCFSLKNEVVPLACSSLLFRLPLRHRREGDICPHRNLWTKALYQPFSTSTLGNNDSEADSRLYSLVSVKVKGSDEAVLKSYTEFIIRAACNLDIDISKRIILPTSIQRHTVLKSPHIYKKHRAQYEVRTHGRMLQVRNVTGDSADVFLEYIQRNIPEGVSMSVEQTALESFPKFFELPPEAKAFLEAQKQDTKLGDEQTQKE